MYLLVGLGNPGTKYAGNRHNIGFMAIDALHRRLGAGPWRSKFSGEAAEASLDGEKLLLLKPQTFMNESGRSVGSAMQFHRIPLERVHVFHDEIDLPPARLRVKLGGGNAGHNGLRSISTHCGNGYPRIRLGIGHPGDKALVHGYVLNDFGRGEAPWVEDLCAAMAEFLPELLANPARFRSRVAEKMAARGHGEPVAREAGKPAGAGPGRREG